MVTSISGIEKAGRLKLRMGTLLSRVNTDVKYVLRHPAFDLSSEITTSFASERVCRLDSNVWI